MKAIRAEEIDFIYLSRGDNLPDKVSVYSAPAVYDQWDNLLSKQLDDLRPIIFSYTFRPEVQHVRFLHWSDGTDLNILDEKVEKSEYADEDFKNAVITTFGRTFCLKCEWQNETLVLHTADVYIGLGKNIEYRKIMEHVWESHCPNCGAVLTQLVAKIF